MRDRAAAGGQIAACPVALAVLGRRRATCSSRRGQHLPARVSEERRDEGERDEDRNDDWASCPARRLLALTALGELGAVAGDT